MATFDGRLHVQTMILSALARVTGRSPAPPLPPPPPAFPIAVAAAATVALVVAALFIMVGRRRKENVLASVLASSWRVANVALLPVLLLTVAEPRASPLLLGVMAVASLGAASCLIGTASLRPAKSAPPSRALSAPSPTPDDCGGGMATPDELAVIYAVKHSLRQSPPPPNLPEDGKVVAVQLLRVVREHGTDARAVERVYRRALAWKRDNLPDKPELDALAESRWLCAAEMPHGEWATRHPGAARMRESRHA